MQTLLGGMVLMLVLGSIHAFSVFLEPLEARFNAERTEVSFTYSLALVCLTISVLFGHLFFARFKPPLAVAVICLAAGLGCVLAGFANSLVLVWLSYSVIFGAANGLGYALALQTSAQANPEHRGLAMGLITACYGLGAALSPIFFDVRMAGSGFRGAMIGLAVVLVLIAPIVFVLFTVSKTQLEVRSKARGKLFYGSPLTTFKLWAGYGTAVTAGLMAIGHAAGIMRTASPNEWMILAAPIIIAILNMIGSLIAGALADRIEAKLLICLLPILSCLALVGMAHVELPFLLLICLGLIGFTYGATISVYPIAVSSIYGAVDGVKAYGRVFTAWGLAGVVGPVTAGYLFTQFGDYYLALLIAAFLSFTSIGIARSV